MNNNKVPIFKNGEPAHYELIIKTFGHSCNYLWTLDIKGIIYYAIDRDAIPNILDDGDYRIETITHNGRLFERALNLQ